MRLPANPSILALIKAPNEALTELRRYMPERSDNRSVLKQFAAQLPMMGAFESTLAEAVDLSRPWGVVSIGDELIVHLPIDVHQLNRVAASLANQPPVGRWGAVKLPPHGSQPGPTIAWLDPGSQTLTLATTERGLATGRHIVPHYGKTDAIGVVLDGDEARKYAPMFRAERLEVHGAGPHSLDVEVQGVPPELLAPLTPLHNGALTELLNSPQIALGASSKYGPYEQDVRTILGQLKYQVDRQNFLVRGPLQDLLRRLGATMRSWNGRVMVGLGPHQHLRLGLGADQPPNMGGSLFHLLRGVQDNLALARSLGMQTPQFRLQRNQANAAGSSISLITLSNARQYLPPQIAPLVDPRGDLRVAVTFPSRANAAMVVIGPQARDVLARWLTDTAASSSFRQGEQHLASATIAVDSSQLPSLATADPDSVLALLQLDAAGTPTRITVMRDDRTLNISIRRSISAPRP